MFDYANKKVGLPEGRPTLVMLLISPGSQPRRG